jgi:hypothetical protein
MDREIAARLRWV